MKEQAENKGSSQFLNTDGGKTKSNAIDIPSIALPKGGGAIKGVDEKFSVNAVNGTASFSIPLPVSQARGVTPSLSLSYNSGSGNGIFGLGWNLGLSSIKRKTDKQLPQYLDGDDSDTFLFSEAEDLVAEFKKDIDGLFIKVGDDYVMNEKISTDGKYKIRFYRPRIEGLFARIERWANKDSSEIKWRIITPDNVTTLFGWTSNSRLTDPNDKTKIFEWLPEFVFDDKGNCSRYIYNKEDKKGFDTSQIHNRNRFVNDEITYANIYLHKVLYGNKTPYQQFGDPFLPEKDFLFETVFDYGTLKTVDNQDKINDWDFRNDAFSDYKAGFEIRTTRLCKRVLLFHHFTDENEYDGLVRSVNFDYDTNAEEDFTFLKKVTSYGYIKKSDGTYSEKKLPAMEFTYQPHDWNKDVRTIDTDEIVNAPSGLDEQQYQFTDLYNEGLNGILTEQANGWYYKHNLGDGKFERAKLVTPKPSFAGLGSAMQLADLDADGGKQLVSYSNEYSGYFELDDDNEWQNFRSFKALPNIDFGDQNTRMLDLNGDGKPEVVISEDNVFTWYPSDGRDGFLPSRKTLKTFDEELGPAVVFANQKQTIFLADMCGTGMTDIVRIRNGEVCYWPNLGYGNFGSKVAMDNAPIFDFPDSFNPSYLRLADIDGSGTSDIIYLGKNKFCCWKNLSGNRFGSEPFEIDSFPEIHSGAKITVTDLLGNGVACIVWSSPLSKDANAPLKYVDLMNSKKPHILISYKNNLGKEVSLEYTPSTKFYVNDKLAGKPWVTKLHFPVHCISKTITEDKISGYKFVSEYKYHHGYYDHTEREFRGFGMVEQIDAETFEHWRKGSQSNIVEEDLHQEPVVTKSWYHTGAFLQKDKILNQFENDYWFEEMEKLGHSISHPEVRLQDAQIVVAAGIDPSLLDQLSAQEWQEALRSCKSMPLRSEIFGLDAIKFGNTDEAQIKELTPFSVATHNCVIELLQPKGKNKHAIFIVKESEAITYSYERNPEDPRITHSLNIKLDEYGNVLESASVVYPRKLVDASLPIETQRQQAKTVIIYNQNRFTNDVFDENNHCMRLPSEIKTFELKYVEKPNAFYTPLDFTEILSDAKSDTNLYHEIEKTNLSGKTQKRLIENTRSTYYRNDLTEGLPLHQLESLAIPFESYQLAYTPDLLSDIFDDRVDSDLLREGKFTNSEGDANWWIRSGTTHFIEEGQLDAKSRFYSPLFFKDPYGAISKVKYYGSYFLFIEEIEDALGNKSSVTDFNFRMMTPTKMKDLNGNFSQSISDELGLVKAVALLGKGNEADDLSGLSEITDTAETDLIKSFFLATDSVQLTNLGKQLLKNASSRFVYDFETYNQLNQPCVFAVITREEHFQQNANAAVQLAFEYSNGLGEVIMQKSQAEPGKAKQVNVDADNRISIKDVDTSLEDPKELRWIGNGRTINNNKGNAVKQYEPYFSVSWHYEDYKELFETGVTPLMYYDAAGRLIKTENPDGTFSRTEFDSWKQLVYDANDTILESSWYKNRMNNLIDVQLIEDGKDPIKEKQAATEAAKHANTPNVLHLDTLGRLILMIEHNRNISSNVDEFYNTRSLLDTEGNLRSVIDARDNTVMTYKYDMLGNAVYQNSMDAGQRWQLTNILSAPLRTWDERNHEFRYFYDILQRPTYRQVISTETENQLNNIFDRAIYGESLLTGNRDNESILQSRNVLGQVIQHYDTGGLICTPDFDFKGQPLFTTRQLFENYKEVPNWQDANLDRGLESEKFTFITETDALGRITKQIAPDGSIIIPSYNISGLLNGESVLHSSTDAAADYIKDVAYNEKGQREKIRYGNGVSTTFHYDKQTFRLKQLESKKLDAEVLQNLYYTYDPVGNISIIEDKAIPIQFFANSVIEPISEYKYDALYRLVEASGRENSAALNFGDCDNWNDKPFMNSVNKGDPMTVRNYMQRYQYDAVGNIMEMKHLAVGGNWTRAYQYETINNRLKSTHIGDIATPSNYTKYRHHEKHGFLEELPHLEKIGWNFKEELVLTSRQHCKAGTIPEITYYQYDGQGQRIRKITENQASNGSTPTKKNERIYIAGYELYKKHSGSNAGLKRTSLSLMDEGHRFVMIESRNEENDGTEKKLVRYQLHNHLGSAALELNDKGQLISYEEYHPFGTTSYQAINASISAAAKRYRYTGMERDEETGMEYHSARYYLPWLGRWLSADPIGIKGGMNLYAYCEGRVIVKNDTNGKDPGSVLSLGRNTLPSEMVCKIPAGLTFNMTEANASRAADVAGRTSTMTVKGMEGFAQTFKAFNSAPRASKELVETALRGEGIVSRTGQSITAVYINAKGVELGAKAESLLHTSAEFGAIKKAVESGKSAVSVFIEGEYGIQAFSAGSKTINMSSTVNLLLDTPVKSFTGAREIATALKPLRPLATATISAAKTLEPVVAKLAPVAAKLAPAATKLAPAAKVLGKVAGPVGIGIGVAQMVTSDSTEGKVNGGITTVSSALLMSKHPVAMAGGAGLMVGQVIESTLDVSSYSSAYGVSVYEGLKSVGANDTVSLVAGGVVTVASTPVAIGVAAIDKTYGAAKDLYHWIRN